MMATFKESSRRRPWVQRLTPVAWVLIAVVAVSCLAITLIGDANQEPRSQQEKQKILATIERQGLRSKVRLLGYQPYRRLLDEAYAHHIFLAPSMTSADGDTEGGAPVTLIDVAASGMPIVSTRHCDIPRIIEDGITGWLAEEQDVEGLTERLRRLVREPSAWDKLLMLLARSDRQSRKAAFWIR